ncbi:MAG: helix-turn-helix transcriptional regulator [Natronospirillum sp.]
MTNNKLEPVREQILAQFSPREVNFAELEVGLDHIYGTNLKHSRLALGWSQEKMATEVGVSLSQYRKYESGSDYARMGTTARYMMRTGVPFQYFFLGGGYDYLFSSLTIRADLLQMQIFVGQSNDSEFNHFLHLLSEMLEVPLPAPLDTDGLIWPSRQEVAAEIDGYYAMVADGLRSFRDVLHIPQDMVADLLGIASSTMGNYERASNEPHFNVIMALRLWAATGVNPLWLTYGSHFFNMRMLQHKRMEYLCQMLHGLPVPALPNLTQAVVALGTLRADVRGSRS